MKNNPHGGDIYTKKIRLDYSVNVNPLGPPESVKKAVRDSVSELDRYPDYTAAALRRALSEKEQVPGSGILFGNGAAELILAICHAVGPKKSLVTAPSFSEYEAALGSVGAEVVYMPLLKENGFRLSEESLDYLTEDLDLVFLCNPNNPTGQLIGQELLYRILEKTREKGIRLVVDECFIEFVSDGAERSLKRYLTDFPNLVILRAFTKTYSIPALRLGYAFSGDPEFVRSVEQHLPGWNLSLPAQKAGLAALSETAYVEQAKQLIETERVRLAEALSGCGCKVWPSATNYLFFASEDDWYDLFLSEGILIRDCGNYPGLGKGYYRIAVKTPKENDVFIERMCAIWQNRS